MAQPLLQVQDLRTQFFTTRGVVHAVDGVTFHVDAGETLGVVGESGCGKTMTALSILRLLPDPGKIMSGRILFRGKDVTKMTDEEIRDFRGNDVAMIFQDPMTSLNPVTRIGSQIEEAMTAHERFTETLARGRVIELLKRVRVPAAESRVKDYPHQFSGGMRQRAMIAMGLSNEPDLLIADELGTALDVSIQDQILEELRELVRTQGLSVLYITHNLGVARLVSDRIYVMYGGEIAEVAPTAAMFSRQLHPYSQGLLAAIPRLSGSIGEGIEGRIPDYIDPPPACRFAPRCPFRMAICDQQRPLLAASEPGRLAACHLYPASTRR